MLILHHLFEFEYLIPRRKKLKIRKINPRTNRIKTFKRTSFFKTTIPPNKRTLNNKPEPVRFQDWLLIKGEKQSPNSEVTSFGKSEADNKYYGWSHRAVAGFGIGDTVKKNTSGNIKPGKEWIIKTEQEARQQAISFAKSVS